ncbi:hypothetical protein UABAM_05091 [Candidatus Uabimicrobium amorphum]|uniref:Uncharacterized protein n=1 Tax=Uabimicrobium amorphum TaxID=2596890 RepID=A0A5S9F6K5_UABAM|nr:hypothetical protein UABAM_05091 [Candidatus Uabimicrobium amorphum]
MSPSDASEGNRDDIDTHASDDPKLFLCLHRKTECRPLF